MWKNSDWSHTSTTCMSTWKTSSLWPSQYSGQMANHRPPLSLECSPFHKRVRQTEPSPVQLHSKNKNIKEFAHIEVFLKWQTGTTILNVIIHRVITGHTMTVLYPGHSNSPKGSTVGFQKFSKAHFKSSKNENDRKLSF